MKKNYEKPEVYTEDIHMTFVGTCCPPGSTPVQFNPMALNYGVPSCGPPCQYATNSYQAG